MRAALVLQYAGDNVAFASAVTTAIRVWSTSAICNAVPISKDMLSG
jgi:hypothetical protein